MTGGRILRREPAHFSSNCTAESCCKPLCLQLRKWHRVVHNGRPIYSTALFSPSCLPVTCRAVREHQTLADLPTGPLHQRETVAEFIRQQPVLKRLVGIADSSGDWEGSGSGEAYSGVNVSELSGGRINFVWRISGPAGECVLKYAAPYVRSIGPAFRLSQTRLGTEAEAMAAAHAACPRHVPALLLYDPAASVLVQELVSEPNGRPRIKLVDALAVRGSSASASANGTDALAAAATAPPLPPPRLAADLASLLAGYLLRNSIYELPYAQHAAASERMRNSEVVAANAAVVFTDPWDAECARNRVPAGLQDEVALLRSDMAVREEVSRLLDLYLSSSETLIHNDLTAGNILVPEPCESTAQPLSGEACGEVGRRDEGEGARGEAGSDTHLIDWEFATYGPMSYDIGSLLGNLLLSYCATCGAALAAQLPAAATVKVAVTAAASGGAGGDAGSVSTANLHIATEAAADDDLVAVEAAEALPEAPLLRTIVEFWEGLEARIQAHQLPARCDGGDSDGGGGGTSAGGPLGDAVVQRVMSDSLGYAGCVMARLVFGMHHYPALEEVACSRRRHRCQRLALRLAAALLRRQERAARGWERSGCGSRVTGAGAGTGDGDRAGLGVGGGGGSSGGIRRLLRDVERWEAEAAEAHDS